MKFEGERIQQTELECQGRPFLSLEGEDGLVAAKVYDFDSKRNWLITGELGGEASVLRV